MNRVAAFIMAAAVSAMAHADPAYISDKLVVNVYPEANQDGEKIATLESGDAVEALEKSEGYTQVKLKDGREGWIKSSYLSTQTPAIVRVKELEKEREKERSSTSNTVPPQIAEELRQLKEQNSLLRGEIDNLKKTPANVPARQVEKPAESISVRSDPPPNLEILKWSGGASLIAILLGFALGYRSVANKIKRKYGNLRIY